MMNQGKLHKVLQGRQPALMGAKNEFAVLCPFVQQDDGLSLLFEIRSASLRRQPGEVCFPGGKFEAGEDAQTCALRETWEELAIPSSAIEIWGMPDFIAHASGFTLHPVAGFLSDSGFRQMKLPPLRFVMSSPCRWSCFAPMLN